MTNFIETDALLAVLDGDLKEAERLIKSMLPGERKQLEAAAETLSDLCHSRCRRCDWHVELCDYIRVLSGPHAGMYHKWCDPRCA